MNSKAITNAITKAFYKTKFALKKHAPDILFWGGIVGIAGGTVLTAIESTKLPEVLDKNKKKIADAVQCAEEDELTEKEAARSLAKARFKACFEVAKLYAPAAAVMTASTASLIGSHSMMKERTATLAAAYMGLERGFKEYRKRIEEKYGADADEEARPDVKEEQVDIVNKETGEITKKTKKSITTENGYSGYEVVFDHTCRGWDRHPELSKCYLVSMEKFLTQKLRTQGFLFLSDVYDELGIMPTKISREVGWLWDPDDANVCGCGFVSFGLDRIDRQGIRNFLNGEERDVILDFNVDGFIMENFERIGRKNLS